MISQVAWFDSVGHADRRVASQSAVRQFAQSCGSQCPVRWAADWQEAANVARGLNDTTSFWSLEQRWREQARSAVQAANRGEALAEALHRLSIMGYDAIRPALADEELARVASGAALWTLAEALTWATVDDVLSPLPNPFLPKLRLFELGHWPLGISQGSIVVA
jgi:hypothetical protein